MKFFTAKTLDELKREYRALAMKHHPDHGGDLETMKALNAEYDRLARLYADREARGETAEERADSADKAWDAAQGLREVVERLIHCVGLTLEVCGSWLWVSGATYAWKDQIKESGLKWASAKKQWYWAPGEWSPKRRGHYTMGQIRDKYGSVTISTDGSPALGAS